MHTPRMKFAMMEFKDGENVTVRRGSKWYSWLSAGDDLLLTDTADNEIVLLPAKVVSSVFITFKDIPTQDINDEHDARCRTYAGLLEEMREVYVGFSEDEGVSVIRFICV